MSFLVSLDSSELHSDVEHLETTAFVAQLTNMRLCGISDDLQFGPDKLNNLSARTFLRYLLRSELLRQLDGELKQVHSTRAMQHARYV